MPAPPGASPRSKRSRWCTKCGHAVSAGLVRGSAAGAGAQRPASPVRDRRPRYVRLHAGRREFLLRETLAGLERLDPEQFVRIHRSAIVQVDRIRELHPASHGDMDVLLTDGTVLTLSRTWRHHLRGLFPKEGR